MQQQKRVGIWLRVSTDMQVKDDSPEHHEQRARYYAQSRDWNVLEVYRLDAVSGKSVMFHPEAKRMLADVRSGHITGLVFSKLARLARNTKELLEFAEIFRTEQADLISLAENIDTSTPAGRLFFTIISAMAEWEREEIAARVAASVPVRAKLGKSLGGAASFGYRWQDNALVIDEQEAPIRKLLYELFLKHQRKKATATALNKLGYRTRNGSLFSGTTVERLLRDSTAKGERVANYTKSLGEKKHWIMKPKEEWIIIPCPAVVSAELWNQCNSILDGQYKKRVKPGRSAVHLLSGLVTCHCGKTMYVFHNTKIYSCRGCRNRISVEDIDEIYQQHLEEYLNGINIHDYLNESDHILKEKQQLLESTLKDRNRLSKQVATLIQLRADAELDKERFKELYQPLEVQLQQLDGYLPELEAEIDIRSMQRLSSETILEDAKQLSQRWANLEFREKRAIVEAITTNVIIDKADITITLAYHPPPSQNGGNRSRNFRDSYWLSALHWQGNPPRVWLLKR
ncbi:MAG: recombinase family protein [Bacteroidetes bacterium]|nr:recombinase family protein [Bacteroidota bacterium]